MSRCIPEGCFSYWIGEAVVRRGLLLTPLVVAAVAYGFILYNGVIGRSATTTALLHVDDASTSVGHKTGPLEDVVQPSRLPDLVEVERRLRLV